MTSKVIWIINISNYRLYSESPRAHLSPWVLFRYNEMLNMMVHGDSEPIPTLYLFSIIKSEYRGLIKCLHLNNFNFN